MRISGKGNVSVLLIPAGSNGRIWFCRFVCLYVFEPALAFDKPDERQKMTDSMSRPATTPKTMGAKIRCLVGTATVWRSTWRLGLAFGMTVRAVSLWAVLFGVGFCGWAEEIEEASLAACRPSPVHERATFNRQKKAVSAALAIFAAEDSQVRLVSTMTGDPWASPSGSESQATVPTMAAPGPLWEFPQPGEGPFLRRLPPVEAQPVDKHAGSPKVKANPPAVLLLPPQTVVAAGSEATSSERVESSGGQKNTPPAPVEARSGPESPAVASEPSWRNLSDQDAALFTGVRTNTKIHELALAKIRHGYRLADRHAYYAARQEFIQVLRMVSRALGAREGSTRRSTDLASGFRALDEAEDFVPRGTGLEADLNVSIIVSAHRTPVAKGLQLREWLPQQLMDRYFRYAQLKLAASVAGNPDGSMALHALGKLQRRLSLLEPEGHPLAYRKAFAYQQAALLAHPFNHLAAHELGVLLADGGRYVEAECLLQQVAAKEPHPIVLRNLAQVQYKLGQAGKAAENDRKAAQLAAQPGAVDRRVRWVSPLEFAHASNATTFGLPVQSSTGRDNKVPAPGLVVGPEAHQVNPADNAMPRNKASVGPRLGQQRLGQSLPVQSARVPASISHPSWFKELR